jgi:hypothetical protein
MHAMDRWIALGIFLLGAGVGALTTIVVYAAQIRHLKDLRQINHENVQPNEQDQKVERRKSA